MQGTERMDAARKKNLLAVSIMQPYAAPLVTLTRLPEFFLLLSLLFPLSLTLSFITNTMFSSLPYVSPCMCFVCTVMLHSCVRLNVQLLTQVSRGLFDSVFARKIATAKEQAKKAKL